MRRLQKAEAPCLGCSRFRAPGLLSLAHMETAAIQTHGLTRRFGELTAVDDVTFSVAPGQFFGFLGPNGAGKSTTIKMLTGLLEPSAGTIEILGKPFQCRALDLKRQIGVVPEGMALLGRLTAPEYLRFVGRMYGLEARRRIAHGRTAGIYATGRRTRKAGDRFLSWHAEETGAGRGGDSRAARCCFWTSRLRVWTRLPPGC